MSNAYLLIRTIHILSATLLLGTGIGTAFHMWFAHRTGDLHAIAAVSANVVLADFLFTTPAIIAQPLSGVALIWLQHGDPWAPWLIASYALFVVAGTCWLAIVGLQIRVRDLARAALAAGRPLPPEYHHSMRLWFRLGWPALAAVLAIFWLMTAQPRLW
ncbi:MAG: DUF2269 family protein [Alphaproteobacteria bacterium]